MAKIPQTEGLRRLHEEAYAVGLVVRELYCVPCTKLQRETTSVFFECVRTFFLPPPPVVKRGDPFAPSSAAVSLGPRTYSETKTVCVLGMGCGRLTSSSELHLRQVGARGNAGRARVSPVPPEIPEKPGGIPPFDNFPFCFGTNKLISERFYFQVVLGITPAI